MSQKRVFNTNAEHIYVNDVPEYNLDLVNARSIDPAYSFTRNSAATYVGPDGIIKTAAVNQPRFDYDPVTGEYKGLLVEEAKTNAFVRTNSFSGRSCVSGTVGAINWLNTGTITPNAGIAPDGTNTATLAGPRTSTLYSNAAGAPVALQGSRICLSVFVKPHPDNTNYNFQFYQGGGNDYGFTFNTSPLGSSQTFSNGYSIKLPNGWYRLVLNRNVASGGAIGLYWSSGSYFLWGAQGENSAYATSHIPALTTAAVTRQPDQLILNRSLNTQGTFFIESNPTTGVPLVADNGSSSLSIGQPTNQYTKSVLYYNNNRTLRMASDNSVPSDYIYTNPQDLNRISLGFDKTTNSNYINGHLKKFSYYSSPLSEDNLRALTGNKVSAFRNDIIQDEDASAYIQLVEFADGQPLEPEVKLAIERFIVGCKTDGIWDAIKASCILAGARTLSGALVPLVGAAPTNYKFTSSRYNRKFGISGSSGMYIDSNRPGNLDPRNSKHFSVYVTNSSNTSGQSRMGHRSSSNLSQIYRGGLSLLELAMSGPNINYSVPRNELGFVAIQRISDTIQQARGGGSTNTQTTSTALNQPALNTYVFAMNNNGLTTNYSTDRLSFYSIGESLDLAKLDSRVTTLMNEISAALP